MKKTKVRYIILIVFSILFLSNNFIVSQNTKTIYVSTDKNSFDSIKNIKGIEVVASRIFKKEEAGMRETLVDSLVMINKVNLSLSDLLSENTSVFIKSHGRGALATASFRGTASSHTQVKWNGMDINSQMTGMVDFSLIPVFIIDDISLKHGTSSIADKSGGLGGSININNKMVIDSGFHLKYIQGIGSFKTFDEYLQLSYGKPKIKLKTRLYHNYSKNNYKYLNRAIINIDPITGEFVNPIDTNKNADFKRYGILQEIYYIPNNSNVFSLRYWGQNSKRTIPRATSYEGAENSNLNNQNNEDHKLVAEYSHYFDKSTLTARSGLNINFIDYILKNQVPGAGLLPAVYSVSSQVSNVNAIKYNYNITKTLSLTASLDFNYHKVNSYDSIKFTGYNINRAEMSAFLSISKRFFNRINTTVMFRQDLTDWKFNPFIPYFGFDAKLLKTENLLLKGNIAKNYHQPSLNDLYWQPGGNPDLLPEDGYSFEIGLEYEKKFEINNSKNKFNTELTFYRSDINNWIIWIPTYKGYWQPMNIKRVLSTGLEYTIGISGNIKNVGYKFKGNYSYTKSLNYGDILVWGDESYGKQLVYVPLHSGNIITSLDYKGYFITYQFNYYSERYTTSSNDVSKRDWLYPYFMSDLFLGKSFKFKNFELSTEFKIYNLLNETYHSILYRPMPKQNYMLQIEIKF